MLHNTLTHAEPRGLLFNWHVRGCDIQFNDDVFLYLIYDI